LSDTFPIKNALKQGDALSPLLLNLALEYVIRTVQAKQDGLKLNGTHKLLVNVDDCNIMGGSVRSIQKNINTLVAASKEIGLEKNADKTEYMVISRDQNAGRYQYIKNDNSSSERMDEFKYL